MPDVKNSLPSDRKAEHRSEGYHLLGVNRSDAFLREALKLFDLTLTKSLRQFPALHSDRPPACNLTFVLAIDP